MWCMWDALFTTWLTLKNIRVCVYTTIRPFLGGIGVWLSDPSHPEEFVSEEINGQAFWPFFESLCMTEVLFYQEPTLLEACLQGAKVFDCFLFFVFFSAPDDKLWVESFYLPLSILGSSLLLGWELHFWWGAGEILHSCCLCQVWCSAGVFDVQNFYLLWLDSINWDLHLPVQYGLGRSGDQ